jgi:hypothetical protein
MSERVFWVRLHDAKTGYQLVGAGYFGSEIKPREDVRHGRKENENGRTSQAHYDQGAAQ